MTANMTQNKPIDILSFSHFLFWLCVGILVKNKYELVFFLGIIWEIIEYIIIKNKYTKELLKKYWPIPQKYWDEQDKNKIYDLIFNMIGYHIGNYIN
tara:strand:- start:136 stop:426 length:291 start_codon:yes stop_codon:yes gene_type:complete